MVLILRTALFSDLTFHKQPCSLPLCSDFDTGGNTWQVILDTKSDMCALEVGGGPWYTTWQTKARILEPVKTLLQLPINVEQLFTPVPQLKPPGL